MNVRKEGSSFRVHKCVCTHMSEAQEKTGDKDRALKGKWYREGESFGCVE